MPRRRPTARPAWWAAAALCLASCAGPPPAAPEPVGCFVGPRRDLLRARRAVLVELDARPDCPPEVPPDTTRALAEAVQRRGLFKVEIVRRSDPACRDLPLGATGALTIEDLAGIHRALGCEAVILGAVTDFQSYPRMRLGLYLRMLDLRDGRLLWAVDHTWDSTRRAVQDRIRSYFEREVSGCEPLDWEIVVNSPRAFEQFVAHEAAATLPARNPPPGACRPVRQATSRPAAPRQPTGAE